MTTRRRAENIRNSWGVHVGKSTSGVWFIWYGWKALSSDGGLCKILKMNKMYITSQKREWCPEKHKCSRHLLWQRWQGGGGNTNGGSQGDSGGSDEGWWCKMSDVRRVLKLGTCVQKARRNRRKLGEKAGFPFFYYKLCVKCGGDFVSLQSFSFFPIEWERRFVVKKRGNTTSKRKKVNRTLT